MAAIDSGIIARPSAFTRLVSFVSGFKAALEQQAEYHKTLAELEALSDRELSDIGVSRASVKDIARNSAFGK